MQKEDLIYLHTVLVHIKRYLEAEDVKADYSAYEALHISPAHIHRNKMDHRKAVFVLGDIIVKAIDSPDNTRHKAKVLLTEKGLADLKV